ncbi:hypothetical protein GH714_033441 [Hevea brasiliensis]|uniref:Uncharacterized protein n=1 Tax=Hevea brasiliensis TaxID=3981 RepID=A0A6A6MLX3_HEVBR|nr:hypothetical protein GH714_033441 [Hevea brasiliensis]
MVGGLVVSAAMADQDQCGGTRSNTAPPAGDGISLNAGLHAVTGPQLKEQFTFENDYSPKVRKPYTITKQRERWTEDEHKKFLEALKLYGRAWRRIEEHVGTKTAVQIRSHAQKFFSKVVREASGNNTSTLEPIEIPPPRPKRKPMHPYPRKMVHPLNNESSIPEQPLRSSSPNYSISEQENQSPTSVLSAVGSDALGSIDSNTPNSSLSPVSCAGGSHPADSSICEPNLTPEDHGSTSPAQQLLQLLMSNLLRTATWEWGMHLESFVTWASWNTLLPAIPKGKLQFCRSWFCCSLPLWAFCGGMPFPLVPFHKQEPLKVHLDSNGEEIQDKEIHKEGSWTGSNSGSVNEGENVDKNIDGETQSPQLSYEEKEPHTVLELKPSEKSASTNKCVKGFVPYKKRMAERGGQSSTITGEEREEQRIRLCL